MNTVANVGAGTGSYEPVQTIVAVEPSVTLLLGSASYVESPATGL